jgi:hypothetical protein
MDGWEGDATGRDATSKMELHHVIYKVWLTWYKSSFTGATYLQIFPHGPVYGKVDALCRSSKVLDVEMLHLDQQYWLNRDWSNVAHHFRTFMHLTNRAFSFLHIQVFLFVILAFSTFPWLYEILVSCIMFIQSESQPSESHASRIFGTSREPHQ